MSADEDVETIDRAVAGDVRACETLVRRYQGVMVSVAAGILGNVEAAEDAAQDAWISAFRALPKFERRSSLKTWLLRIVANEARDRLRRQHRELRLDDWLGPGADTAFDDSGHWATPPQLWDHATPEALLSERHLRDCLEKHIGLLPPAQRAALTLRDMEGLEFSEIASTLGASEQNVRVLLHRARLRVYGMIDHYEETGQC